MEQAEKIKIALAGNPNCGKTTIFNNITGAKQHVGNYPGVTVEKKEGHCSFGGKELMFVDLPGTYSLTARSLDEVVARNVIINEKPDIIVNVLDASNLERNLYLAAQLVELGRPVVVALNMMDIAERMGVKIDLKKLGEELGAVVVPLIGSKNIGTKDLLVVIADENKTQNLVNAKVDYGADVEPYVQELTDAINKTGIIDYPIRWLAVKLLENDSDVVAKIRSMDGMQNILNLASKMRNDLKDKIDLDFYFAQCRHQFAVQAFNHSVIAVGTGDTLSDKIDRVLTHRILGIPIFLALMWAMFTAVIDIGAYPQEWLDTLFGMLGDWLSGVIADEQIRSLVVDGVVGGVGSVMSFVPLIVILYFFISLLEDTGYMARAAFLIDRVMRAMGLHGKSFIPMILGFGCTVPGIMAARTLDNEKDRLVTIFAAPFMSCGARLPVYTLLIAAFFGASGNGGTVLFGIYLLGIIVAILVAVVLRHTLFKGEKEPFVMELPPYHIPTVKDVLMHMWERSVLYLKKAGTFILGASIIVWFLTAYPMDVEYSQDFEAARANVEGTYTVVLHRNHHFTRFIPGLHHQLQVHIRSFILHRIIHEIENHIRDVHFICKDYRIGCFQVRLNLPVVPFHFQGKRIDYAGNQFIGIQFLHFQCRLLPVEHRHLENLLDLEPQPLRLIINDTRYMLEHCRRFAYRRVFQHLRRQRNG